QRHGKPGRLKLPFEDDVVERIAEHETAAGPRFGHFDQLPRIDPRLGTDHHRFHRRQGVAHAHDVVDQLGRAAGAYLTDVKDALAERLEDRCTGVKRLLAAAYHDRQRAEAGPAYATADRRVERVHPPGGTGLRNRADQARRTGAHVDVEVARMRTCDD